MKSGVFMRAVNYDKKTTSGHKFTCQCKNGHVFDYRDRIKYEINNPHYALCQGKCPICGCIEFCFIDNAENIYPEKLNLNF